MQSAPNTKGRPRWYPVLFLLPFVWQVGLAPWANTVAWTPLGLPFQMVWQMTGVVITSLCLMTIFREDRKRPSGRENPGEGAGR